MSGSTGMAGSASPPSIRFINRVYPPDSGATGTLLAQLARALAARGHAVSVLASAGPGSPTQQDDHGVRVHRVHSLPVSRHGLAGRALSDLSLYPALLARAARLPVADITVVMTDPPMAVTLGPLIRFLKGGKLVHWAQDLYPDVATALGAIAPDGMLAHSLGALSHRALMACDRIVTPGRCMAERLVAGGVSEERVEVIPNWIDPDQCHPIPREENPFIHEWGLEGRQVVMYAGNFGRAHPMHLLVEAATALKERDDIVWVLVGDGPRRPELERAVQAHGLDNVQLRPFQPRERLAAMLSAANLHVTLLDPRLEGLVVPSKLYGILAAGRPCLFAGPEGAEPARIIGALKCGSVLTDIENGESFTRSVLAWLEDPSRCDRAGQNALRYAREHTPQTAFTAFFQMLDGLKSRPVAVPKLEDP